MLDAPEASTRQHERLPFADGQRIVDRGLRHIDCRGGARRPRPDGEREGDSGQREHLGIKSEPYVQAGPYLTGLDHGGCFFGAVYRTEGATGWQERAARQAREDRVLAYGLGP